MTGRLHSVKFAVTIDYSIHAVSTIVSSATVSVPGRTESAIGKWRLAESG